MLGEHDSEVFLSPTAVGGQQTATSAENPAFDGVAERWHPMVVAWLSPSNREGDYQIYRHDAL
jgi:hypothetical protein